MVNVCSVKYLCNVSFSLVMYEFQLLCVIAKSTCYCWLFALFDHSYKCVVVFCISFYCCMTKHHKFSTLKHYKLIISKLLCVRRLCTSYQGPLLKVSPDWNQSVSRAATTPEAQGPLQPHSGHSQNSVFVVRLRSLCSCWLLAWGHTQHLDFSQSWALSQHGSLVLLWGQ